MKKHRLAVAISCLLAATPLWAIDTFQVQDIRVDGLQRISPGTVFNYLPVKVGDTLTDDAARDAIRALYKTGFFKDVRLDRDGNVLVVAVEERPTIDSIKISGTREIDEETLRKGLKEIGLSEGRVFDNSLLEKIEQELKRQYFSSGRYAVRVQTTVSPLERNRVGIAIDVSEGKVAKIQQVVLVGNKTFSDKELLSQFSLGTSHWLSFFTKNDQYSKPKLSGDLEVLRSYYQNRGFLDFAIQSTQVSISPDKEQIYVTVNVNEGRRYTVTDIRLAGRLIVPEETLRKLITLKPGDVFSRQRLTESAKSISDRLGDEGYAFANINPVPEVNKEAGTVSFTYHVDPGQRVYVRRIRFVGNTSTRDEVLRREFRQFEGAWFSTRNVRRSRERLERLGFFEEVKIETPPVPGVPDQVDIVVTVKERLVNNFLLAVGYSDVDGLVLSGSITLKNMFGTGKELLLAADNSSSSKNFNLTYTNPYYTLDGISRSFNLFSTRTDAAEAQIAAYNSSSFGGSVFFGIPISEDRSVTLGLGYEKVTLDVTTTSAKIAQDFVAVNGDSNGAFKGTLGWAYDTVDNPYFPTRGTLHRVTAEVAIPGSDLEYYRLSYSTSHYIPITPDYTFRLKAELGYGIGYGETKELPFYKNFYAGGASSVRGFRARSLGPKDIGGPDETLPVGGSKRVIGNAEFFFPVPGTGTEGKNMRLSLFVDAGMVYGPAEKIEFGELRYSTGLAFNWFSPLGPLSISIAAPLNAKDTDRTETVQFTLGTVIR